MPGFSPSPDLPPRGRLRAGLGVFRIYPVNDPRRLFLKDGVGIMQL
jgi:hypothetical protein